MNKQYLYKYVKEEIDNMAFIQETIKLKKAGKIYKGICPFHNEKTASFTVYPPGFLHKGERQPFASFYCFGCGQGGDIIKFNQLLKNLDSYQTSAIDLAQQYELEIKDDDNIRINYLKKQSLDTVNLLDIEEINLLCSKMLHKFIGNTETIDFLKYLDEELDNRNTYQAQSLIQETEDFIKALK